MKDREYIIKFSKIQIGKICDKKKIARQNIYTGKASAEKLKEVREEIESELAKLYIKEENKNGK